MKSKALQGILNSSNEFDTLLKNIMIVAFLTWNVIEGSVFENEYPYAFVKLYTIPIWRLLLVILMILAALWNHSLGIMVAFTMFFYVMDMEVTMDKWK
jgi:hypothetical protein